MVKKSCSMMVTLILVAVFLTAGSFRPSPALAQEKTNIKIFSVPLGGTVYVLSFALAEVINKYHPWIRAEGLEGRGSMANLKILAENPAARKNTLIFTNELSEIYAKNAVKPFTKPYKGARAIAAMSGTTVLFVTLDKNIKTKDDFIGKRVMTMRPGSSTTILHQILIKDVWKIGDKVKLSFGDFAASKDGLKDGLIDIGVQPITGYPGVAWEATPALDELMATKEVYFIDLPPEDVKAIAKISGFPVAPSKVPAGSIGPKQTNPAQGYGHSLSWWVDETMDEKVVYEITKVIYDYADKFADYAGAQGKLVSRKSMAKVDVAEELFHPGALKFYKEKGMKVGEE
ncbi:MAG: TAXI family TRAP transporter solute-binding subunit [Desulfobacterales bacterium]|nr:TAXI family TRAP transporter solute-binding subunit [Desulfobacterales bacterium]